MFLNMATRPDFSFAILKLSQFCNDLTIRHINSLLRILKYLRKITDLGLVYTNLVANNSTDVRHFTDTAFADNKEDRRFTYGYVITNSGAAYVWYLRK